MKKLQILIAATLASAMVLTACGGKGGQTSETESPAASQETTTQATTATEPATTESSSGEEDTSDASAEESSADESGSDGEAEGSSREGFNTVSPEGLQERLSKENSGSDSSELTMTLPVSAQELKDMLSGAGDATVVIQADGSNNSLEIEDFISVPEGVTLLLEEGVSLSVAEEGTLNVGGSLEVQADVTNDGSIILMEEGFLQVDGSFTNTGLLSNGDLDKDTPDGETQNCQIVAASGITNTGGILNAGMIDGVVTNNEGTITLIGGTVKNIISNGGQIIEDGGKYGA